MGMCHHWYSPWVHTSLASIAVHLTVLNIVLAANFSINRKNKCKFSEISLQECTVLNTYKQHIHVNLLAYFLLSNEHSKSRIGFLFWDVMHDVLQCPSWRAHNENRTASQADRPRFQGRWKTYWTEVIAVCCIGVPGSQFFWFKILEWCALLNW